MSAQFEGEFKVGDHVRGLDPNYWPEHNGVLEVIYMDQDSGYGVGLIGNDPKKAHDIEHGWVWYNPDEVEAVK